MKSHGMIEMYLYVARERFSMPLNPQRESRVDFISVAFGVRLSKLQQQQAAGFK